METSAGLAVIVGDSILLVKPRGLAEGFYSIPKGLVDAGETFLAAAIRETYEETAILVGQSHIDPTPHCCNYVSKAGTITKRVYYFVARLSGDQLRQTGTIDADEVEHIGFYKRREAEKLIYWKMLSILNHIDPSGFSVRELSILEQLNIITRVKHPIHPIFLYNYTEKCKRIQFWNDTTLWCRGLVLDINGQVLARPFKKFFEEHQLYADFMPSDTHFTIHEKIDGALGMLFFYKNKPIFCNRQSFKSRQAVVASEIFYDQYARYLGALQTDTTYLFEIVYPNNRFVVNYGNTRDLFLLGMIDRRSGQDVFLENAFFKIPAVMQHHDSLDKKGEGAVLRYRNGFKLKVKNDFYRQRYAEIAQIKADFTEKASYLANKNHDRQNWNVDYNRLYAVFARKYLFLYVNYLRESGLSQDQILKKIASRKMFPG